MVSDRLEVRATGSAGVVEGGGGATGCQGVRGGEGCERYVTRPDLDPTGRQVFVWVCETAENS